MNVWFCSVLCLYVCVCLCVLCCLLCVCWLGSLDCVLFAFVCVALFVGSLVLYFCGCVCL